MAVNKNNKISELRLIEYCKNIFKTRNPSVLKGIGDDAAVVKIANDKYLLSTCDMLIEDRHFTKKDSLYDVGYKAVSCSLSDIAAMGGEPKFLLLSLGIPKRFRFGDVDKLLKGVKKAAGKFCVDIIGGDTNSSDKLIIDVCIMGFVKRRNLVFRDGAKDRDYIFVTGSLGGSIYGRHLKFTPKVKEAKFLTDNFKINSMIDITDGLVLDLWRMLKASSVGAIIFEKFLPQYKDAKNIQEVLYMGEDFELLFTVDKDVGDTLLDKIKQKEIGFLLSFIGQVIKEDARVWLVNKNNKLRNLKPRGFVHF